MACATPSLRDVDIRAVWDGVPDHAVAVDLCIRLECRLHTRVLVLDRSHELIEAAAVARIRHIPPPVHEEVRSVDDANARDRIGDSVGPLDIGVLSPLDAEGLFTWGEELPATHQSQLARLYRDITSLESFSPVVAAQRWREIRESDGIALAVDGSDAGGGSGERRVESSPTSAREHGRTAPSTLSVRKRGQRSARADRRWRAGLAVPPLRKRSKSLGSGGSGGSSFNISARTPRIVSGDCGEPDQVGTCSATSLGTLRRITVERARSCSDPHRHVLGVSDWMCSSVLVPTWISAKGPPHTPNRQCTKAISDAFNSQNVLFSEETDIQTRPSTPDKAASRVYPQCSDNLDTTALQILDRWKAPHEVERSNTTVQSLVVHHKAPSWVEEDGKLYIVCGEDTTSGTYEVDLKARVRLLALDAQHHQSFCIPGLIRAEVARDRTSTGGFAFYFEPTVHTSGGMAMRFGSKTLIDYHIKESSHIIGRFRLDETPLISIRTKKPAHCISDFSASIEACTAFLPSTDSGVRRLYYNARLICEANEEDVWANQVEFFIVVRYGPSGNAKYHVNNGTCAALHNTLLLSSGAKESEALISVLRNTEDIHNHLDISFSIPIDVSSPTEFSLPTLRPLFGKVLSESIFLGLPWLPLKLEHIQKDSHTVWKVLRYSEGGHKMMRFDRLPIPDTLPQIMEDNPQFQVSELVRVLFRGLSATDQSRTNENPVSVARNLQVALFRISGGRLGCQIDVEVQIGKSSEVLTIDPQGWLPSLSYVDGRLATQNHGEWRELDDKFLTLFNTRDVKEGKIVHITFFFEQPCSTPILEEDYVVIERDCNGDGVEKPLPRVVGMTILQAHLRLELENCTMVLSNPPESRATRFSRRRGHTQVHLPMLTSDYHFSFIRDTPQPTTPPHERIKDEPPPMNEEEPTLVARDTLVNGPGEHEQDELRPEDGMQVQVRDVGLEQESPDKSPVMIDKALLGEESTIQTAEPGGPTSLFCRRPWSKHSRSEKVFCCLWYYVFIPLVMLTQAFSTMGKIVTDRACPYFNDPCPLITLRDMIRSRPGMAENFTQSALNGHDSNTYASHTKLGEDGGIEKEDRHGHILPNHVDARVQQEEDTGVLDWIDHALGWKG